MGDRANCIIKTEGHANLWFYTHWTGTELPVIVQTALKRRQRWDDPSYLARIIFCEMVKGQESDETGFGISTFQGDNEHRYVVVEPDTQRISFYEASRGQEALFGTPVASWTFEEYVKLDTKTIERAYSKYGHEEEEAQ